MPRIALVIGLALLAAVASGDEPTSGYNAFHQLRPLSGLPGALHGADEDGRLTFQGPVALSTPVANTLGHGKWVAAWSQYSFTERPIFANTDGNWSAYAMNGQTLGAVNVAVSGMLVSDIPEFVFSAQAQLVRGVGQRFIPAVGIQDIFNRTKTPTPTGKKSSRTVYAVGTYRLDMGRAPLYISAGIGTRRFRTPFGSASMEVARYVRAWVEHDTFGWNAGLLVTTPFRMGGRDYVWTTNLGRARGRYMQLGTGLQF
jgi:hypothetical protein